MPQLAIISLQYKEKYYTQTLQCLEGLPYPVFFADRNGVGNISKAFNYTFRQHVQGKFDYVWFITNITFDPQIPEKLLSGIGDYAAIHPAHYSDFDFLHPSDKGVQEIPFIEFNCPLFRCDVFEKYMLDEDHHYAFMDLIISKQVRDSGLNLAVHHGAEVGHVYLNRNPKKEHITRKREAMRRHREKVELRILAQKYGPDYQKILWNYNL